MRQSLGEQSPHVASIIQTWIEALSADLIFAAKLVKNNGKFQSPELHDSKG